MTRALGSQVAIGAAWMIGLRLLQRSLGLISTAIVARLLLPADFGLIAMALSVSALVELLSVLGLDLALIRRTNADRRDFDTAWTLGLIARAAAALLMIACAAPAAAFYDEPRLAHLIYVYAAVTLLSGFENIGIVAFRKELEFHREFRFQLTKKLLAVVATISFAAVFRNYWALALGTLASQVIGVALSYRMHPYRARLTLVSWRELLGFSGWMVFNNLALFARDRGTDFVTGKFLGAEPLGGYRVASEIAALPTTELNMPIMRAVFPGFSKIVTDRVRLQGAYLLAQGAVSTATLPVVALLILCSEAFVLTLLGPRWGIATPLVQILAVYGGLKILHGNRFSLLMALGRPNIIGAMVVLELLVTYPLVIYWLSAGGNVEMVAWARVIAALLTLPAGMTVVSRAIGLTRFALVGALWRPLVATAAMTIAVVELQMALPPLNSTFSAILHLVACGATGAMTYGLVLLSLWVVTGRPVGVETWTIDHAVARGLLPGRLARLLRKDANVL